LAQIGNNDGNILPRAVFSWHGTVKPARLVQHFAGMRTTQSMQRVVRRKSPNARAGE
jgi:hypothetical protein